MRKHGAGEWIRTTDLRFTKPLLYQLSYAGFGETCARIEGGTLSSALNLTHAILSLSTCFAIGGWTRLLARLDECRSNLTDRTC